MKEKNVLRAINAGSGVHQITRKQAGEIYRAAKKVTTGELTYWKRNKRKETK